MDCIPQAEKHVTYPLYIILNKMTQKDRNSGNGLYSLEGDNQESITIYYKN